MRNAVTQSNCGIVNGDKCIVVGRAAAGLIVLAAARVDAASIDAIVRRCSVIPNSSLIARRLPSHVASDTRRRAWREGDHRRWERHWTAMDDWLQRHQVLAAYNPGNPLPAMRIFILFVLS